MRKLLSCAFLALVVALPAPAVRGADADPAEPDLRKLKVKELPEKYRTWLEEEVYYIITDRERDVFLRLKTDELREIFIRQFWERRDPVPTTPENEYREEHKKRLSYVREYYKIMRQDRARVYITMGPPTKVNGYHNTSDWWPMEVWEYEGLASPELPHRITLLFYKPRNAGLFRLWSPTMDGFKALRTVSPPSPSMDLEFNPGQYLPNIIAEAIRGVAPGLGPFGSERVLSEVQKPPKVDLAGVENILTGTVTTAISYAALPVRAIVKSYWGDDPTRRDVSVALEVPAAEVKYTGYKGKSYFGLFVAGQVRRGKGGKGTIVAEWSGNVDSSMSPEERERTVGSPFLYTYRFRLLPGSYTLNLVARDDASQRLGIVDLPLEIAPPASGAYQLSDPVLPLKLSRLEDASGNIYAPFVFDRVEMLPSVEQVLSTRQPPTAFLQVKHPKGGNPDGLSLAYRLLPSGAPPGGKPAWEDVDALLSDKANDLGVQSVLKQLDLRAVPEGSYELLIELRRAAADGSAETLATSTTKLRLTPSPVPTARILARSFATEDPAAGAVTAGVELIAQGKLPEAREQFRLALAHDPDSLAAKINLARVMVLSGELAAARDAMLEVTATVQDAQALMVLGSARSGLGEHTEAVAAYEKALAVGGESPERLNALAEALHQAGDKARAREVARKSLALAPDQPLLERFLKELE